MKQAFEISHPKKIGNSSSRKLDLSSGSISSKRFIQEEEKKPKQNILAQENQILCPSSGSSNSQIILPAASINRNASRPHLFSHMSFGKRNPPPELNMELIEDSSNHYGAAIPQPPESQRNNFSNNAFPIISQPVLSPLAPYSYPGPRFMENTSINNFAQISPMNIRGISNTVHYSPLNIRMVSTPTMLQSLGKFPTNQEGDKQ